MTTSPQFEAFLARVYVDPKFRELFLQDPAGQAKRAGLSEMEGQALERIDRSGLELAARSFTAKRNKKPRQTGWFHRFFQR